MVGTWKIVTGHARINFENRPTCYSSEDDDHDEKRGSGLDLCRRGMTIGSMTMGVWLWKYDYDDAKKWPANSSSPISFETRRFL